jgi:hypothetical protein
MALEVLFSISKDLSRRELCYFEKVSFACVQLSTAVIMRKALQSGKARDHP